MNPGTFTGLSVGAAGQSISRYTQSPTITSSRTIAVPEGVKRIEALLCGGGGGGGLAGQNGGGGGFGGLAIIEIPVTGSPLQVVIGAGGAAGTNTEPTNGGDGSPTYIVSAGTRYAEVGGGGGGGGVVNGASTPGWPGNGRSGGGGGGASQNSSYISNGGDGGPAPIGNILWTWAPNTLRKQLGSMISPRFPYQIAVFTTTAEGATRYVQTTAGAGSPTENSIAMGGDGALGGGGGGAFSNPGCGGGNGTPSIPGGGGALGRSGSAGGSMASVTIWGITGKAGGASFDGNGGGGGGMLEPGTLDNWWAGGGSGGLGGGGGAGGVSRCGSGGAGFAVIRFYF